MEAVILLMEMPVSGAFGFQGEVGFNFYDEHRTFREIALEGYQNIDMIEYIGRLLLQIITVINPYKAIFISLTDINIEELQNYCLKICTSRSDAANNPKKNI